MPTARSELSAATLGGQIYVAGGLRALGATRIFERYDPASKRWERRADLPRGLHHFAMASVRGRIYVTGGYTGPDFSVDNAATWAYDPDGDAWGRRADMPVPRAAHAAVVLGGKLYVVGGLGPRPEAVWRYDPESDRWDDTPAPLPTPREHLAAAVLNGRLYAVGGRWRGAGNLALMEVYDPVVDSWSRGRDMPTARGGLTAAALGDRIHVTGGEAFSPPQTFGQHEVYDPGSGGWSTAPSLPTPRHGLSSVSLGGLWYVIGGGTEAGWRTIVSLSDQVEFYRPRSD